MTPLIIMLYGLLDSIRLEGAMFAVCAPMRVSKWGPYWSLREFQRISRKKGIFIIILS